MDIFDFLFYIVRKFKIVPTSELDDMQSEMQSWRLEKMLKKDTDNKIALFYQKHMRTWYAKLALALLTIPTVRWLSDYMASGGKDNEFESDELG